MLRVLCLLCLTLLLTSCGNAPEKLAKIEDIDPEFAKTVLQSKVPVLVDFWAPWCGPCLVVAPILEEIAAENKGKFILVKVNIDDKKEVADYYGIESYPTFVLFRNGATHRRMEGVPPRDTKAQLSRWLNKALAE